jgi:hypothetical protein
MQTNCKAVNHFKTRCTLEVLFNCIALRSDVLRCDAQGLTGKLRNPDRRSRKT